MLVYVAAGVRVLRAPPGEWVRAEAQAAGGALR